MLASAESFAIIAIMARPRRRSPQAQAAHDDPELRARGADVIAAADRYRAAIDGQKAARGAVIACVMTLRDKGMTSVAIRALDARAIVNSRVAEYKLDRAASPARLVEVLDAREAAEAERLNALDGLCIAAKIAADDRGITYRNIGYLAGVTEQYVQQLVVRGRTGAWPFQAKRTVNA